MQVKIHLGDLVHLLWQHIVDPNIGVSVDGRSLRAMVELPGDRELGSGLGCISLIDQGRDLSQDVIISTSFNKIADGYVQCVRSCRVRFLLCLLLHPIDWDSL